MLIYQTGTNVSRGEIPPGLAADGHEQDADDPKDEVQNQKCVADS